MPTYTRKKNIRKAKTRNGGKLPGWIFPSFADPHLYLENFYMCHKAKIYSYRCKFIKQYGKNEYQIVGEENKRVFKKLMFETMIKFLREMSEKSNINKLHDNNTIHAAAVLKLFKLIANNIYVITEKNGNTYQQTIRLKSDFNKNTVWYKRYWNKVVKSAYNYLTNEDKFFYLSNLLEILQTTYDAPINARTDIVNVIQEIYQQIMPRIITYDDLRYHLQQYLNGNVNKYADIGLWDISHITTLSQLFSFPLTVIDTPEKNALIAGISLWKVGHVSDIAEMFDGCVAFNQPLNHWNVSNCDFMHNLFRGCSAFNQPLDKWRKFKCINLSSMFEGCSAFNQPLNGWDVSNVVTMDSMFKNCSVFNQPLFRWNVSNVRNMENMFNGCTAFNQDLTEWDVNPHEEYTLAQFSNETKIDHMFDGCDSLTTFPFWYLETFNFPKNKNPPIQITRNASSIIAGSSLPNGIPTTPPNDVVPFDPITSKVGYWSPIKIYCQDFIKQTLTNEERSLIRQYMGSPCYLYVIDCFVGNRLTTYLLTKHPEIIKKYPEYNNPLVLEEFSHHDPVVFEFRYMSEKKLLAILRGFRALNNLLKKFPTLEPILYPEGIYLYRGKSYEGEIERLAEGQEFLLSKLTSTSVNVTFSARNFARSIQSQYYHEDIKVTKCLGFLWRIKFPLGLPLAYINNEYEYEVVLPLGTRLKYLGAYVQPCGKNAIYKEPTKIQNMAEEITVEGALICEFEVVSIEHGPLLSALTNAVEEDFQKGDTAIYAKNLTIPGDWDRYLRPQKEIEENEAFGKRKSPRKNSKLTRRMRKRGYTHTPKRKRPRDTRKK
jgi:surface protein